jgi:hypothetical protein
MHVIYHIRKVVSSPLLKVSFVQQRSGTYTTQLEMGRFDGAKFRTFTNVHRRWGQQWVNHQLR